MTLRQDRSVLRYGQFFINDVKKVLLRGQARNRPAVDEEAGCAVDFEPLAFFYIAVSLAAIRTTPTGILRLHFRYASASAAEAVQPVVRAAGAVLAYALMPDVTGFVLDDDDSLRWRRLSRPLLAPAQHMSAPLFGVGLLPGSLGADCCCILLAFVTAL